MCVYKEGNLTCFARLLRPADFGNNSPPDVGDSVETIDGEVVGERGYDYIRQILANNGGKSVCLVGFRRKCDPAITKRVSENEYDLHLPVTERGLGIRINAKKEKEGPVYLEKFFRILDADSEVTPKVEEGGDVIVGIDGVDAAALGYKAVKDLFTNHEGRSERIIRLRKNLVTEGSTPATINGENGTTQRASGINGTLQGTVQMAGAKLNGHPSGEYGPAQPAIVPEFDVKVRMTQKGPGIVVSQSGGNAVFEQFHDFAQLMGSPSPVRGDEIVAIDGITVHDFQYQRVIETLKNAQDGQWRTIRFRSKLH